MTNRRANRTTTKYVAVRGVSYVPDGAKDDADELRVAPGEPVTKCPPALIDEYLERGDIAPAEDAPPTPDPEAADGASEGDDDQE